MHGWGRRYGTNPVERFFATTRQFNPRSFFDVHPETSGTWKWVVLENFNFPFINNILLEMYGDNAYARSSRSSGDASSMQQHRTSKHNQMDRVLDFIIRIVQTSDAVRRALFHAGILVLLLVIVDNVVRGAAPRPSCLQHIHTSITCLNSVAAALLDEPQWRKWCRVAGSPNPFAEWTSLRRTIDTAFGEIDGVPLGATYVATRELFQGFLK